MDLWIPLTIAATAVQAARTAFAETPDRATDCNRGDVFPFSLRLAHDFSRFGNSVDNDRRTLTRPNTGFVTYAWTGGLVQLLGNALLLHLLGFSTFTVGTTYTKTEVIQTTMVSDVVLGDRIESGGMVGIIAAFVGVVLMAIGRTGLSLTSFITALQHKPALYGLCVGTFYAIAAVFYRAAALSLSEGDFFLRALTTLAWVTTAQAVAMTLWVRWRTPDVFTNVIRAWPVGLWVGFTGIIASACWYTAFYATERVLCHGPRPNRVDFCLYRFQVPL